jgi:hypothetical protein
MDLADLMKRHARHTFQNRRHFGVRGQYQPEGATSAFPVTIGLGDPTDTITELTGGRGQQWQLSGTALLSELCNGILIALGDERQPIPGDEWTVETGEYAGVWRVAGVTPDHGDAVVLALRYERPLMLAGAGTKSAGGG